MRSLVVVVRARNRIINIIGAVWRETLHWQQRRLRAGGGLRLILGIFGVVRWEPDHSEAIIFVCTITAAPGSLLLGQFCAANRASFWRLLPLIA